MSDLSGKEQHRKFAVELFNLTWSLLDKKDRTREDDERMVHAAYASRFHWRARPAYPEKCIALKNKPIRRGRMKRLS